MKKKSFLLVGSGGYIAPRHVKAIKAVGGELIGCVDINFTPESLAMLPEDITTSSSIEAFASEFKDSIDYVVVCSPNFLHEEHITQGLSIGSNIISEKPIALNSEGIEKLISAENHSKGSLFTILQLRLHPVMREIQSLVSETFGSQNQINLKYIAKRDENYFKSWKGDMSLSGGLLLNVGVHYFDLLLNVFGDDLSIKLEEHTNKRSKGTLILEKASVSWLFSFEEEDIKNYVHDGQAAFREITIDGKELDFSSVSEDLHVESYKKIISNQGYTILDARKSIDLVDKINNLKI